MITNSSSFALVLASNNGTQNNNSNLSLTVDRYNNQQEEDFFQKMVKSIAKETARKVFDINKYYKNFKRIKELDENKHKSANDVVLCDRKDGNRPVALKIKKTKKNLQDDEWEKDYNWTKFEIYYCDKLCNKGHPNIITTSQFWIDEPNYTVYIEMERCDQSLSAYMDKKNYNVDIVTCCALLKQAVSALYFCHAHSIIHGDVKEQNMLLIADRSGRPGREDCFTLKLADFEASREVGPDGKLPYTEQVNDRSYLPFEILVAKPYLTYAVDMYALGCMFLQMIGGDAMLYASLDWQTQLNRINSHSGPLGDKLWMGSSNYRNLIRPLPEDAGDLLQEFPFLRNHHDCVEKFIKQLLDPDQTTRMTSFSAKHDPFFHVFKQQ